MLVQFKLFEGYVDGKSHWSTLDQVNAPHISDGEFISTQCRFEGKPDPSIIATTYGEGKGDWANASSWAVRLNYELGLFEKISPKGIDCWIGIG